jgi:anti-sigma factor ChrR (cupin superfamily)
MILLPGCRETSRLMTHYQEGQLPLRKSLAIRLHLALCPPCQAFSDSLKGLPGLVRRALGPATPPEPDASARAALEGALARLDEPRGPRPGPCCELPEPVRAAVASGQADRSLQVMVQIHARLLEEGPVTAAPHLPASTLQALSPPASWKWSSPGPGGMRFARLLEEGSTTLFLVRLGSEMAGPAHRHLGAEQTLLLQGGLEDGPRHFGPGAWSLQEPGSQHAPAATGEGCWALVRVEQGVQLQGWRGWLQRLAGS